METFSIINHNETVGEATVVTCGLYYRISCLCKGIETMRQIIVEGESGTVNLGTCVPLANGMGMNTSVAVKRLGKNLHFRLADKHATFAKRIQLVEKQPVDSLSVITKAVFKKENNRCFLSVGEKDQSQTVT